MPDRQAMSNLLLSPGNGLLLLLLLELHFLDSLYSAADNKCRGQNLQNNLRMLFSEV
jgi:hypothetical protein